MHTLVNNLINYLELEFKFKEVRYIFSHGKNDKYK